MQGVFLHGGDQELVAGREGDLRVRAGPEQLVRLLLFDAREPDGDTVIGGAVELSPVGREHQVGHRGLVREHQFGLLQQVADEDLLGRSIGDDLALRRCGDGVDPQALVRHQLDRARILGRPHHAAVITAGDDAEAGRMDDGTQDTGIGMGVEGLAGVGEDDLAVGQGNDGIVQRVEQGGDDIGVMVLRIGDGHGALIRGCWGFRKCV